MSFALVVPSQGRAGEWACLTSRRILLALVLLTGCTGWYAHPDVLVAPIPVDDQVRLCARAQCRQVHAVRVTGDSLTAVPYFQRADCDSCTLHYAMTEIDSVQTRGPNTSATAFLLVVTVPAALGYLYLLSRLSGD